MIDSAYWVSYWVLEVVLALVTSLGICVAGEFGWGDAGLPGLLSRRQVGWSMEGCVEVFVQSG